MKSATVLFTVACSLFGGAAAQTSLCFSDGNSDGTVGIADLLALLGEFGTDDCIIGGDEPTP